MKKYASASLIWITLFLCSSGINNGDLLNIPTQVISIKSAQHENIKGTKIYVLKPKGFTYDLTSNSFVKTPNTYFRAVESPTVSFNHQRTQFLSEIEYQKKCGINQIISICIDKLEEIDLSKIQDFINDLSPTNFKVNSFQYGMFLFKPNGLGNPNGGITNMLLVKTISPLVSDYVNRGVKVK